MREKENIVNLTLPIAGVVILTLFCLLLCCPPGQRPDMFGMKTLLRDYRVNYGLDLKGGSELLYQVDPKEIDSKRTVDDVIGDTIEVISQRIYESKIVNDPRIQQQGGERILIQLPGLNQTETALIKKEIENLGNMEFRLVASQKIGKELDEAEELTKSSFARQKGRWQEYESNLAQLGYRWFPSRESKGTENRLLWINDGYNFTGTKFQRFYPTVGDDGQVIGFELKEEHKSAFARFTEKYKGQKLAIVFNNKVVAAPGIRDRIPGQGIMVGFQPEELKDLLKVLRSGSLQIQPELLNENTIGPSLGEDTIHTGILAGWVGVAFVVIFMTVYYLAGGFVASLAGMLNVLLIGAVMVMTKETLTLPGIAGVMLTLGMSVDANVLIFERIREEKRKRLDSLPDKQTKVIPKPELLECTDKGFENAFSAIFDSNVTTLITSVILYIFATGPVKGFAFTLGVGLIANFFTAIVVTKVLLHLLIKVGLIREMAMLDWVRTPRIPFARLMPLGALLSIICIVVGMSLFFSRGDANYGLDLKGGLLAQISLEEPLTTKEVRNRLNAKFSQLEVQHIETNTGSSRNGWYSFAIRLPNLHQKEIATIDEQLRSITQALRPKNDALQQYSSKVIRLEQEDLKEAQRELRNLEEGKENRDRIEQTRERIKLCEQDIDKYKQSIAGLSQEVEQLKSERSRLVAEKNKLAGIEELRREIEAQFAKEISPRPFGKLDKPNQGSWKSYYQIELNLATLVSRQFVEEALKSQPNFKEVALGSSDYYLYVKPAGEDANADKAIAEAIAKHCDIIGRVAPVQTSVEKVNQGSYAGYFSIQLKFARAVPEFVVREALGKCNFQESKIVLSLGNKEQKSFCLFLLLPYEFIGAKSPAELQQFVEENLNRSFQGKTYQGNAIYFSDPFPRFTQLSGVVAEAQKAKAVQAILLSLMALLFYIAVRFPHGLRFGVGATVGLAHDVLITLGAMAVVAYLGLFTAEIDLTAISALLTLVGYGINDTIVNFDRIRENQQKHETWYRLSKQGLTRQYELAFNQTLSRTLITGVTTLGVLLAMFILNLNKGNALDGFSFILLIGILASTYASLFIASYIVLAWERRDHVAE